MSATDDAELVRQCAEDRSQPAFALLVERHAPLVYSAARRLTVDADLARDVTQAVFLDLLNKITQVWDLMESQRPSAPATLAGWLHRAARYEALELIRSESRRQIRERKAMEFLVQDTDAEVRWEVARPVIDEALDSLPEPDRQAILLRYFQGLGFRQIGAALGLSDDAAQKRVSRSLDRLREQFAERGITTTAAALGAALAAHAVELLPAGLAGEVATTVWSIARIPSIGSSAAKSAPPVRPSWVPLPALVGLGVVLLLGALLWFARRETPPALLALDSDPLSEAVATPAPVESAADVVASGNPGEERRIRLQVFSAETGAPLPDVRLRPQYSADSLWAFPLPHQTTDSTGRAEMAYPTNAIVVAIRLEIEGFADTQLAWNQTRGLTIPEAYEVRLVRAPRIGGLVVNTAGIPLPEAKVQLNLPDGRAEVGQIQTHLGDLVLTTDPSGRWSTARIAGELLSRIQGFPWRKDHIMPGWIRFAEQPDGVSRLLAGTHVFTLDPGLSLRGRVLDSSDVPVAGAHVLLGDYGSNRRSSAVTATNGEFVLGGAVAGREIITALEHSRGVGFQIVEVSDATGFISLRLEPFRTLHLQTVDPDGNPVGRVRVDWEYLGLESGAFDETPGPPTAQLSFQQNTDDQGRLTWTEAPADVLYLSFHPQDHVQRHQVSLSADGTVQVVVLEPMLPAQIIRGVVRDDTTGEPVARFRVREGSPTRRREGQIDADWYPNSSMHAHDFHGGRFELKFTNDANDDPSRFRRLFHISAEGYESGITRVVQGNEGEVELEVDLHPATSRVIQVFGVDGAVAAGVPVAAVFPGHRIQLRPTGAGQLEDFVSERPLDPVTDARGQFVLRSTERIPHLVCADETGVGWTSSEALQLNPVLQLEPWARLSGVVQAGIAPPLTKISLRPVRSVLWYGHPLIDWSGFEVEVNGEGRFEFPRVPPGEVALGYWSASGDKNPVFIKLRELPVAAGEVAEVEVILPGVTK